jgi:DNA-binding MarR family transcriptional regulator
MRLEIQWIDVGARIFYDRVMEVLPVSTLLSYALVAFTIEFDNEFERRMPHRTTMAQGLKTATPAPWLVSLVMWSNCMQYVGEEGVTIRDLERLARTKSNLNGMERWGYISMQPDPSDNRPHPPVSGWVIRATPAGRKAQEIWRQLFRVIEQRWKERFGNNEIRNLTEFLVMLDRQLGAELPDCLPILGYGLFSTPPKLERGAPMPRGPENTSSSALPALLSRVLLAFVLEFERESEVSLAISANVLRVLGKEGVRFSDLPGLTAVSRESIAMSLNYLSKHGYCAIEKKPPTSRTKFVRLTPKGVDAQNVYEKLVWAIEKRWNSRFGDDNLGKLRAALEQLIGEPPAGLERLLRGAQPYPGGWRAAVSRPEGLPHYPMVLHRGGFPDGS